MLKEATQPNWLRSLLYAYMCGDNGSEVSEKEFLAACNRFGIDNPMPVICQRLYFYGNNEPVEKILETAYKKHNEAAYFDPENYCGIIEPAENKITKLDLNATAKNKDENRLVDMQETKVKKREVKKKSGAYDIRMLDRLENMHKFTSPPEAIIVRGCTIKINDILQEGSIK